jgi:hypothetical protein
MLAKEKPGPFRRQLLTALEARLREKGAVLSDTASTDVLAGLMFGKIFDELAAPTEVWSWSSEDGPPHGDVLIRKTVKVMPGVTSGAFLKTYTVSPRGKRIDRGFLNTPCTLEVSTAGSEAEWFDEVEQKSGWVASVQPVLVSENVARVAVQLLSPGRAEVPSARHERPVWIGFFQREKDGAEWTLALFEPYTALEQKLQETNALPADPKEKLVDQQKQLLLSLRMHDLSLVNPARKVLAAQELKYVQLDGLTESPVDAKHLAWLEPWRAAPNPLQRAVAVLRLHQLGGAVSPEELLGVLDTVRALAVQAEALGAIGQLVESSKEVASAEDVAALAKNGEEVKTFKTVARVRGAGKPVYYRRTAKGWAIIAPAK